MPWKALFEIYPVARLSGVASGYPALSAIVSLFMRQMSPFGTSSLEKNVETSNPRKNFYRCYTGALTLPYNWSLLLNVLLN